MSTRRLTAALLAVVMLCSIAPAAVASNGVGTGVAETLEGRLELEVSEQVHPGGRMTAEYDYSVRDDHGKRTHVTFKGEPPAGFSSGARVRIKGHRSGTSVTADGELTVLADVGANDASTGAGELRAAATTQGATTQGATTAAAAGPVTKRLKVILVNFASNPVQPYTASYADGVIFTNTSSVAAFYDEDSYGRLALTGDVSGWFTISYDTSTCDTAAIQTRADAAAAAAGVSLSGYTNISYVFPHLDACSFAGRAQLPGARSWINTISATTPKIHDWVVAHELGHNFGVNHANSYECAIDGVRVTLGMSGADCDNTEYGDPLTIMGAWNPITRYPHNIAWHRLQMGFIDPSARRTVTVSGIYTLGATAFADSSPKALRINRAKSTAIRHWFEIEFRQPDVLFDGFASTAAVVKGASIRLVADDDELRQSFLLDATPGTASYADAPLGVGKTFTDPLSGLAITTMGIVTDVAGHPALKLKVVFPNTPPPTAPGAFAAESSIDGQTATLSWSPAVTAVGVAGYRLYRDEVLVATLPADATGYTDPDRTPGTTHAYRIEAFDWIDLVGASSTASVLMLVPELGTTTAWFGDQVADTGGGTDGTGASDGTGAVESIQATNATTVAYALHFSAPVTRLTADALTLSGTATGCAITGLSGSGADYVVTVSGCSEGTLGVSITAGAAYDHIGYLAPAADATSVTTLIDRTAPAPKKPAVQLREGATLAGSSVPVRLVLGATEVGSGVASFDIGRSVDGGAYTTLLSATTSTSISTALAPGHSYRFRVRSRDNAGNVSAWAEGLTLKPALLQESSTAIAYRGSWYGTQATGYSGGAARSTTSSTATATATVSGRGVAIVMTQAATRGKVKVYVDGAFVRTIDLAGAGTAYRALAFTQMFASSGTHVIKLVGLGTSGRPRIDLDAMAVLR